MGLSIYGTNKTIHWNYSTLHYGVRQLAMLHCGMPLAVCYGNVDPKEHNAFQYFMHPLSSNPHQVSSDKVRGVFFAAQIATHLFPNIMLHSDCDGSYTRRGAINTYTLKTGNIKKLHAELKVLVENVTVEKYPDFTYCIQWLTDFYELVSDEIENGKGIVRFR